MRKLAAGMVVMCLIMMSMYHQPLRAADDWYVDDNGSDTNSCTSWADACKTITFVLLNKASSGDTIHVAAGTYDDETFPIKILGSTFTSLSLLGEDASTTIIHNAATDEDVIEVQSATVTISNFTVKGGDDGIYLADGATGTISDNIITESSSNAINIVSSNPTIRNNFIYNCDDGIQAQDSGSTIMNNTITGISKKGIRDYSGSLKIINNVITQNGSDGVYCQDSDSIITNNTIVGNADTGISVILATPPKIFNNIIASNGKGNCANCSGLHVDDNIVIENDYNDVWNNGPDGMKNYSGYASAGTHDISANPLFTGDYHLQCSSPALNAGSNTVPEIPSTDKDGEARIQNGIVDMGAYEGCTPAAAPRKLPSLLPLTQNNISRGGDLAGQADDLLTQAKSKNLNTDLCEKLIDEANDLLTKAKKNMTNPIYANNMALRAMEKLKQAIDCLKALLG